MVAFPIPRLPSIAISEKHWDTCLSLFLWIGAHVDADADVAGMGGEGGDISGERLSS